MTTDLLKAVRSAELILAIADFVGRAGPIDNR